MNVASLLQSVRLPTMNVRPSRRSLMLGALAVALSSGARAQAYPSRPIRWLVGSAPGGASDTLTRTVGQAMSTQLGQPILVDNRSGASGMIAGEAAARAEADGYTLWTGDNGTLGNNFGLFKKVPYRREDFFPIGAMARISLLIVANPKAPYTSATQLVDAIRKQPGAINYATPGLGTPHNIAMEMLKDRNQLNATPVHYRGGPPGIQDLLAGHVQLMALDVATASPYLKERRMKALGIFSKNRHPDFPDVPSLFELGLIDVEAVAWLGLFGQASLPAAVKTKLTSAFQIVMKQPQVTTILRDIGFEPMGYTSEDTQRLLDGDYAFWVKLIHDKNIVAE